MNEIIDVNTIIDDFYKQKNEEEKRLIRKEKIYYGDKLQLLRDSLKDKKRNRNKIEIEIRRIESYMYQI
jgi:hypothetical protein